MQAKVEHETLLRGEIRAAVETDGLRIEDGNNAFTPTRRKDMWCGTEMNVLVH